MLRLAAQVQARTQQLAAANGQGEQLLNRTHGSNLTGCAGGWQLSVHASTRLHAYTSLSKNTHPIARGIAEHQEMGIE